MTTHRPKRTVVSVDSPLGGVTIACDSGAAWITQCCDSMDYVLTAGMDFAAQSQGKIVVQVVRDGNISIRLRGLSPDGYPRRSPVKSIGFWGASIRRWGCRLLGGRLCGARKSRPAATAAFDRRGRFK